MTPDTFARFQALAELALAQWGVTFSVYSDQRGTEKVMPVCLVPRVLAATEWTRLERGLVQRLTRAADVPRRPLRRAEGPSRPRHPGGAGARLASTYLPRLRGLKPPGGVRIHIAGIDLIRSPDGVLRVLEDNLRTPSGVSYVIENRLVTKRMFPTALERLASAASTTIRPSWSTCCGRCRPIDPDEVDASSCSRPGPFNSAYFEHSFLARSMGIELVEASDLFVDGDEVFVRTTHGPRRVHVIYRRTDDAFIDPEFFRPDSMLGVPGPDARLRAGKVALANAPGNGVADDKAIYPFVPDMIRYYLGEEPLLDQVPTYVCARRRRPQVRPGAPGRAGGQGGRRGRRLRHADGPAGERRRARGVPRAHRRRPAQVHRAAPHRAVDLPDLDRRPSGGWSRAASTCGPSCSPARRALGAARAASRASRCATGSYVVNSSQGGGSKDTWVQAEPRRDLARRRSPLLVRPLSRARREHRAPAAGHAHAGPRRRAAAAALLAARW